MNKDQIIVARLRRALEGHWPHPNELDTWAFLVTECAEVGDVLLRLGYGSEIYVRNNPKEVDLAGELADTYLMLITLANHFNIDLSIALDGCVTKLYRKFDDQS